MTMNSGLIFIKNNPYLSMAIAVIALYIVSLIPSDIWMLLFFIAAIRGQHR